MRAYEYLMWAAFTFCLSACTDVKYTDVSTQHGYEVLVGTTYNVVSPITAYGIRKHSKAPVESVSLIPPPGITGSEVGFRVPIPIGTRLTVINVYETNVLLDPSASLGVRLHEVSLPADVPIRVHLMRGNQGDERLSLNPKIFRKN